MSLSRWLRSLPGLRSVADLRTEVNAMRWELRRIERTAAAQLAATNAAYLDALLRDARYADPRHLAHHELRVHSQSGEDGVLAEIFRRVGPGERTFVEIGVESGVETNTTLLLRTGWRGWWVEGNAENAARARELFAPWIADGRLTVIEAFVRSDNVAAMLRQAGVPSRVDLLSVDIDRNTWHAWQALRELRARVAVVEYNAAFGPTMDWVIDDAPTKSWNGTVNFGASLAAYERLGREQGMSLVGCGLSGSNAYFVESALAEAHFVGPFTSAAMWEPPRYWLRPNDGHPTGPLD